jgi:hypothetical protein
MRGRRVARKSGYAAGGMTTVGWSFRQGRMLVEESQVTHLRYPPRIFLWSWRTSLSFP